MLAAATRLYRGEFLAGFGLPDSPAFDEWQFFHTEETRQALMDGLARLVRLQIGAGEIEQALDLARRWSILDPINEEAHRALMQIYAWNGQRSAAVRQYQECRHILQQELAIEPESATTNLFERIRSGQIDREQASSLAPDVSRQSPSEPFETTGLDPAKSGPIDTLPTPVTPFFGRHDELQYITDRLLDPDYRLITLLGPGGIGKTRLAIQAAGQLRQHFKHGVCFVSLASLRSRQQILHAIVDALGLPIAEQELPVSEQLLGFLHPRQLLLVLDNFEHLVPEARFVSELLQEAPQLTILATSRVRLNLHGEWAAEIPGLSFPDSSAIESLPNDSGIIDTYHAVGFFLQAAQRARADFTLASVDYPVVARITQLVAGIPLGLELAAAWINVLSPEDIAAEIEAGLDFLETDTQDVPARQRSIRATFEYSWKLMSKREQRRSFPNSPFSEGDSRGQRPRRYWGFHRAT